MRGLKLIDLKSKDQVRKASWVGQCLHNDGKDENMGIHPIYQGLPIQNIQSDARKAGRTNWHQFCHILQFNKFNTIRASSGRNGPKRRNFY